MGRARHHQQLHRRRRAHGSEIEDADGRRYIDFATGIGSLNLGHANELIAAAIHDQVDRYLHQCVIVGLYEPYVEVCRRLAEMAPIAGPLKSLLVNSGAEGVENAVKACRAATRRPAIVVLDRGFHGRTLLTLSMSGRVDPFKRDFGPYRPRSTVRLRRIPIAGHGRSGARRTRRPVRLVDLGDRRRLRRR